MVRCASEGRASDTRCAICGQRDNTGITDAAGAWISRSGKEQMTGYLATAGPAIGEAARPCVAPTRGLSERILDGEKRYLLPVLEVLVHQPPAAGFKRSRDYQRVVEAVAESIVDAKRTVIHINRCRHLHHWREYVLQVRTRTGDVQRHSGLAQRRIQELPNDLRANASIARQDCLPDDRIGDR